MEGGGGGGGGADGRVGGGGLLEALGIFGVLMLATTRSEYPWGIGIRFVQRSLFFPHRTPLLQI